MKKAYKLEVVVESVQIKKVLDILRKENISGYTLIEQVAGKGNKGGEVDFSSIGGIYKNSYLFTVADREPIEQVIAQLEPIMRDYSGVVYMSETWDMEM